MKRLICAFISFLLLFALCACSIDVTINPSGSPSDTPSDTTLPEGSTQDGTTPSGSTSGDGLGTTDTTDTPSTDGGSTAGGKLPTSMKDLDNGVLERASLSAMDVPENMKLLGTKTATEENNSTKIEATVVLYSLDGDVVNWKTENDLIYVITRGNNRLVVIDAKSMSPVCNVPLAGVPAEINFVGDTVCVSLPDLCRIDVFAKAGCAKVETLFFDHEVSSFCFDGDFVFYSEHDQHCRVFRKNLVTGELVSIEGEGYRSFYQPKLLFNAEDRILYIGETGSSGSTLFYFDGDTLQQKSAFRKNDYGIMNHTREIFHIGDEIFWGSYRLSDTSARELIGKYGTASWGSVAFASSELVSTYEGLFLTETYECVIDYSQAGFEYLLITDSYHAFFRQRIGDKNIILGVNFNLQEAFEQFEKNDPIGTT